MALTNMGNGSVATVRVTEQAGFWKQTKRNDAASKVTLGAKERGEEKLLLCLGICPEPFMGKSIKVARQLPVQLPEALLLHQLWLSWLSSQL